MTKPTSFRLSRETLDMLDKLVERENEFLRDVGAYGLSYSRADIVQLLIRLAYQASERGYSFQDLLTLPDREGGVKGIVE
ncbi:hypothetical protein A5N86_16630 [Geobacillus thermoleovorans]|uniref:hypothetical protein n=1 Tax=Geobacillus thermoleovorans TaxID=33941 RepID=UPI00083AF0F6|nr:hypothetical protein [Geobacillus thermoleovorans]ODA15321.1 hypothetical protein A5N86_16630 [Geobacillus thermoleovorans]